MKLIAVCILLFASYAQGAEIELVWKHDVETCEDNTVAAGNCPTNGYEIQRKDPGRPDWVVVQGFAASVTSKVYKDVAPGSCFRVRAASKPPGFINTTWSAPSNEVCIPTSVPRAPMITITIITSSG